MARRVTTLVDKLLSDKEHDAVLQIIQFLGIIGALGGSVLGLICILIGRIPTLLPGIGAVLFGSKHDPSLDTSSQHGFVTIGDILTCIAVICIVITTLVQCWKYKTRMEVNEVDETDKNALVNVVVDHVEGDGDGHVCA